MPLTQRRRNQIDQAIGNIPVVPRIICIYGGITEQPIEDRKREHINQRLPPGFTNDTRIINVLNITVSEHNRPRQLEQIRLAEDYLIQQLNETYGNVCVNDRNIDGTMAQRGGVGIDANNVGEVYHVYIMLLPHTIVFV